jgi:hypothetical protein
MLQPINTFLTSESSHNLWQCRDKAYKIHPKILPSPSPSLSSLHKMVK